MNLHDLWEQSKQRLQSVSPLSSRSPKKGTKRAPAPKGKKGASASKRKKGAPASKRKKGKFAVGATPPDVWWERWLWYAHPRRFRDWWFTKPGALAALRIAGVIAAVAVAALAGLFLYFARDLPSPGELNATSLHQTTRFYDRTGETVLYEVFGDEHRIFVDLDDIGDNVKNATIAIEDRNFYDQGAFSSFSILRAAINNVLNRDQGVQGGSTITQQYVKNALLTPDQTFNRKVRELILSLQIEQLYDKDDILELYLNEIGYGAQSYGVQTASQMYFSKDADELEIIEAAMLAALPQAPTFYSPYGQNTEALEERTDIVINLMLEQGYITDEEAEEALEADLLAHVNDTPDAYRDIKAPHFVLSVQEELEAHYGAQEFVQGGFEVTTTIDLEKQEIAERAVAENIDNVDQGGGDNASLVSTDPATGQVLAMVGSRDFEHPEFGIYNAAAANRQPGSSFKPYVYAEAFETGNWGAGSVLYDVRTDFGNYTPQNFDSGFRDNVTIRQALAESRNIPAVKMLYIVGLDRTLELVDDLGISTLGDSSRYGLSLVLGSGEVRLDEHVNGYATFANGGVHYEQTKILQVHDSDGNLVDDWSETESERIFDEQTAYIMSDILSDDASRQPTFGALSPNFNVPGRTVAVKTGTTDDQRDGWMMGYTPSLAAGVWVGNSDNAPMIAETSRTTGPIFTQYMEQVLEEDEPFERPDGVQSVAIDRYTGDLASDNSESTVSDLFPSWYEGTNPEELRTATIDTISGDLATDCTPERAREEVTGYGIRAEIPRDDPAFHRWDPPVQELASRLGVEGGGGIPTRESDTHSCNDERPSISLSAEEASGGNIEVTVRVQSGTFPIDEVNVSYNGERIERFRSAGTHRFTYRTSGVGSYRFSAEVIDEGLYDNSANSNSVRVRGSDDDDDDNDDNGNGNGSPQSQRNSVFSNRSAILTPLFSWRIVLS